MSAVASPNPLPRLLLGEETADILDCVRGRLGARSVKPKFPEIPVQNQMERNISKTLFRKFRSTSRGCPFSENLEIPEISCSIWHSIIKSICPTAFAGSWLAILHKHERQYLLFGCNEWSPMWISYRHATSLDNSLAENMREVCTFPFSSENDF